MLLNITARLNKIVKALDRSDWLEKKYPFYPVGFRPQEVERDYGNVITIQGDIRLVRLAPWKVKDRKTAVAYAQGVFDDKKYQDKDIEVYKWNDSIKKYTKVF